MTDEPTVWKIAIRDEIRAFMVTDPSPYWATTVSERDWFLDKQLKRPREDYVVEEVPGPVEHALHVERARFELVRRQLREERHLERRRLSEPARPGGHREDDRRPDQVVRRRVSGRHATVTLS